MTQIRKALYALLDTESRRSEGLSVLNKFIAGVILFSILIVIIETEPTIYNAYADVFQAVDMVLMLFFVTEYLMRLWIVGENEKYRGIRGRFRYASTPTAIVDLLAILPFFLGFGGTNSFLLRAVRLLRIFALAKLGRFSKALHQLGQAVAKRRYELGISFLLSVIILLFSATVMYLVEGPYQPDIFGSIPRSLWWAVATLTTVGYGDVFPITPVGKLCAGLTALAAIGIIAMPTGVLAAAFSDAFQLDQEDDGSSQACAD